MKAIIYTLLILSVFMIQSCESKPGKPALPSDPVSFSPGSFGYDLQFLQNYDSGLIVLGKTPVQIIVSPKYQAKVFTSTLAGDSGRSFGWVHYKAFDGTPDAHMNAYGGENRLWLGPEGGKFSLFFSPGAKMEFASWKTPAAFDTESWTVKERSGATVTLEKQLALKNYAGTELKGFIKRKITVLSRTIISALLNSVLDSSLAVVGYSTENTILNQGMIPWTAVTGMPCIWMLDMFPPSDSTTVVIPFTKDIKNSKPATTNYFGEIPDSRIKIKADVLFFKTDGKMRGKLGMHPGAALSVAGSYDAIHRVLTIALFDIDQSASYLNQEWITTKPPFSGDAVNSYNDGPLADGSQMGPFYEIESVSPAAFLKPGEKLSHKHCVFHFSGTEDQLNGLTQKLLGVSIRDIKTAF